MNVQRSRPVYHGLNALRGVAAIAVLLLHIPECFGIPFDFRGGLAVDLFFLMSGFVIASAYDGRLESGLPTWSFIKLRLLRFYPAYLIALTFVAVRIAALFWSHEPSAKLLERCLEFLAALFFLPYPPGSFGLPSLYPLNAPTWSLAVELIVNAAYAAFHRLMTNRVLLLISIIAALALMNVGRTFAEGGWDWSNYYVGYVRALFSFPVGVLLYRFRDHLRGLPKAAPIAPFALAVCLYGLPTPWYAPLFILVLSPLIVAAATGPMPRWSERFCTFLGRTSYPIYVLHIPVFELTSTVMKMAHLNPVAVASLSSVSLLSVCWYIDLVDERLRRRLSKHV